MEYLVKKEERQPVVFSVEGSKVFGVLHSPIVKEKAPYVLFCHGLAGHKVGKHRVYVKISEQLAFMGIGSLRIDFRGSGDSEGHFEDVTISSKVKDAKKALEFLLDDERVDRKRIGILGRSLGAVVAILTAKESLEVKSMALWSPVFSGKQWHHLLDAYQNEEITEEKRRDLLRFNTQLASMNLYKELFEIDLGSSLNTLSSTSMMIITPEKDTILDYSHTKGYLASRKEAIGKTALEKMPESDHDFSDPKERNLSILKTVEWFSETL